MASLAFSRGTVLLLMQAAQSAPLLLLSQTKCPSSHPTKCSLSNPANSQELLPMPITLPSNRGTALLLMQAAQSAQRITLMVLMITFRSNPARATNPLPTRPLLMQQLLDSRRVQPLAPNRWTALPLM